MALWPMVLDIPKDDCSRILRRMGMLGNEKQLQTYASCISVLRAQGPLTKDKRLAIDNLRHIFHIKTDRHKAEVRRAVNDELLTTISERYVKCQSEISASSISNLYFSVDCTAKTLPSIGQLKDADLSLW
jgi:hypothetical protein